MNSTVNYGYETQISAISAIDRDLKRVEDKADANAVAITEAEKQIIESRKDIECLAGKVNCKDCGQKLENHKKSPHAHEELFEQKVDKQEGYGLISDAELEQIDRNQQDIAVLDGRVTASEERIEKTYTQHEVDALLAGKIDCTYPEIFSLPLESGCVRLNAGEFAKTEFGMVFVTFKVEKDDQSDFPKKNNIKIAQLPDGYHPGKYYVHTGGYALTSDGYKFCGVFVSPSGGVYVDTTEPCSILLGSISFIAA